MLYHGTSSVYETSIKAKGLMPMPQLKYQREDAPGDWNAGELPAVYITPDKLSAEIFAQFRSDWLRARVGEIVWFNGVSPKRKIGGETIPDAKPLLVEITKPVPAAIEPNDNGDSEYLVTTSVPPELLRFIPVRDLPNLDRNKQFKSAIERRQYQRNVLAAIGNNWHLSR